jgi:hypothetical protein
MLKININIDMSGALAKLAAAKEQVPFATALALTRTAQFVKEAEREAMGEAFKALTPFTRNSLGVTAATKTNLTAYVGVRGDENGAARSLRPEIFGGSRKRGLETALFRAGLPPPGMAAVPGKFAKMRGGHVDIAWAAALAAAITVQGASGITIGMTKRRNLRRGGAEQYFVLTEKRGRLLPGIYGKKARQVFPYIIFVREPKYSARFNFFGIGQAAARARFPIEFDLALKKALATAR